MTTAADILKQQYSEDERDAETIAFLGGVIVFGGYRVQPATPAALAVLEIAGNPAASFISNMDLYTFEDLAMLIYVCSRDCSGLFKIDQREVDNIASQLVSADLSAIKAELSLMIKTAVTGFEMIPNNGSNNTGGKMDYERVYDAEWLSWVVSITHKQTGLLPDDILYHTSLLQIGFYVAEYCKENGAKGIARKRDYTEVIRAMRKRRKAKNGTESQG